MEMSRLGLLGFRARVGETMDISERAFLPS